MISEEELKKQKEIDTEIERMFNASENGEGLISEISAKFPDLEQWYIWEILTVLSGGDVIGGDE